MKLSQARHIFLADNARDANVRSNQNSRARPQLHVALCGVCIKSRQKTQILIATGNLQTQKKRIFSGFFMKTV